MKEEITLLDYKEMLKKLEGETCHLLLGNGFNRSLGVDTSYPAIFEKMTENNHGIYKEAKNIAAESDYDLEKFIERLTADIKSENVFLRKYVANKVKYDFMKAAHEIIKAEIKNIYAERNEGVFMLLQHFTNYFTLNYDSFLYLLLLNFKLEDGDVKERTLALQPSLKFEGEDMDEIQNNIYAEIKTARETGVVDIKFGKGSDSTSESMGDLTKKNFISEIEIYSKKNNKGWKTTDIERAVRSILEEEKKNKILDTIDDGSKQETMFNDKKEFVFDIDRETQNLFFLHGAFHIYGDGKKEKKITQETDKALYDRLEEILNDEEKEIVTIFQAENKTEEIKKSEYLKKGLSKLSTLSGKLVIIGCSFSENDAHIFQQIEKSGVKTIFISSREGSKAKNYNRAKSFFKTKEIFLFDADSISYQLPA